jgi:lysophospholipase L1-like esterase
MSRGEYYNWKNEKEGDRQADEEAETMSCGRSLTAWALFALFVAAIVAGCGVGGGPADAGAPVARRNLGTKATAFGDSITAGLQASSDQRRYANLVASTIGWTLTNKAQSGGLLADQATAIYSETVAPDADSFILTGYNDMRRFGTDNEGLAYFRNALSATMAWLALPESAKVRASGDNVVYTGVWGPTPAFPWMGKYSSQQGATATFSVNGPVIYVGGSVELAGTGTFSITVDGTIRATAGCGTNRTPSSGLRYAPFLVRIGGLQDIRHQVVLTVTSAAGNVFFDWAAGVAPAPLSAQSPYVYVGNTLRMRADAYSLGGPGTNSGSDAAVALYNDAIKSVCGGLSSDGLNAVYVDASSRYDPNGADLSFDLVHPSDQGMAKIAEAFIQTMGK